MPSLASSPLSSVDSSCGYGAAAIDLHPTTNDHGTLFHDASLIKMPPQEPAARLCGRARDNVGAILCRQVIFIREVDEATIVKDNRPSLYPLH